MAGFSFKWSTAAVLLLAVVVSHHAMAEIACGDAVARILPCEAFLLGSGPAPTIACCSEVQSLGQIAAASQQDRRAICRCFKEAAKSMPIDQAKAQQLPQLCNVTLGVTISPNVDCDSI